MSTPLQKSADESNAPSSPEGRVRYFRRVIKIRAVDSPNVRLAMAEMEAGRTPSNRMLVPGLLSWREYCKRRATWNKIRQTIGLDAEFWEGADVLLYPPDWIARAHLIDLQLQGKPRQAKSIGIDSGEGGDKSTWAVGDEHGLIALESMLTPDTTMIPKHTIYLGRKYGVPAKKWIFDRGGGGKQHVDYLRDRGYDAVTVGFGESATASVKKTGVRLSYKERVEEKEDKYVYVNKRAEMYGEYSHLLDPAYGRGFGIPSGDMGDAYTELINQMTVIPKLLDKEGRIWMLPKRNKNKDSKEPSLIKLIGHSPDELDAVVLMVHGLTKQVRAVVAGVAF